MMYKMMQISIKSAINILPETMLISIERGQLVVRLPLVKKTGETGHTEKSDASMLFENQDKIISIEATNASGSKMIVYDEIKLSQEICLRTDQTFERKFVDWQRKRQYLMSLWQSSPLWQKLKWAHSGIKLLDTSEAATHRVLNWAINQKEVLINIDNPIKMTDSLGNSSAMIRKYSPTSKCNSTNSIKAAKECQHANLLEKGVKFIDENFYKNIELKDVANHVYLSPCYFSRLFKREKDCGVLEYITRVRMSQACKLLVNTNLKIQEIAEKVGYEDSRYFSHVFKMKYGCTPSSYRINSLNC